MPDREPLPPGQLPNITDTDPPPLNPATEVGDGFVRVNPEKLPKAEHETHNERHDTSGRAGTHPHPAARPARY